MAVIGGIFQSDGLPRNGATAKLWASGAFGSPPAKNTAIPGGSPLQSATTGSTHGGDGAWRFTGVSAGLYYVSIEWNGAIVYDTVNVQSDTYTTVKTYGATGDGVTDDTTAVQAALNDTAVGELVFPPGNYKCGNLTITGRQRLRVIGAGGYITWNGSAGVGNQIGIQLTGSCEDISIEGLMTIGDTGGNGHCGVWSTGAVTLLNTRITRCRFVSGDRGVKIGQSGGGSITSLLIDNCEFDQQRGTGSAQGEGIYFETDDAVLNAVRIKGNRFLSCRKYAIHFARGKDVLIQGNQFMSHRSTVSNGTQVPAVRITRANDVTISGNEFKQSRDGSIEVIPQLTAALTNVNIEGNKFPDTINDVPDIIIGTTNPAADGIVERCTIKDNQHYKTGVNISSVLINCGKRLEISDNQITMLLISSGTRGAIRLVGQSDGGGTATYNDDIKIVDNQVHVSAAGGAGVAIDLASAICTSTAKLRFLLNEVTGGNDFLCGTGVTDPNLILLGGVAGFSGSAAVTYTTLNATQFSFGRPFVVKAFADSPYTALGTDDIIICNTAGGAITVNLPTAVGRAGKHYSISRQGANAVTIDPAGAETVGGAATYTLGADGATVQIISDGANWRIFGSGS